ncbi:MAG: hypothetical protein ACNS60_20075 [Candidatus Cyclobacteriaceae bacterium M2_1C_046]
MRIGAVTVLVLFISFSSTSQVIKVWDEFDAARMEYIFYAENQTFEKYTVEVNFDGILENVSFSHRLPFKGTVDRGKTEIFKLKKIRADAHVNYTYAFSFRRGCDRYRLKNDIEYLFPVKPNTQTHIVQIGNPSENPAPNTFYALNFRLKKGDPVYAVRMGKIIAIKNSTEDPDKYIEVQHEDCTIARYTTLSTDGAMHNLGDTVFPGEILSSFQGNSDFLNLQFMYGVDEGWVYYTPKFYLFDHGKLPIDQEVVSKFSDEIIMQEMTRRDRKRFQSNKLRVQPVKN